MKTILIENEGATLRVLQQLLATCCPEVQIIGTAHSIASALKVIGLHPNC